MSRKILVRVCFQILVRVCFQMRFRHLETHYGRGATNQNLGEEKADGNRFTSRA